VLLRLLFIAAEVLVVDMVMTGIDAYKLERKKAIGEMIEELLEE
jgi:hypothetical protein